MADMSSAPKRSKEGVLEYQRLLNIVIFANSKDARAASKKLPEELRAHARMLRKERQANWRKMGPFRQSVADKARDRARVRRGLREAERENSKYDHPEMR